MSGYLTHQKMCNKSTLEALRIIAPSYDNLMISKSHLLIHTARNFITRVALLLQGTSINSNDNLCGSTV